MAFFQLEAHFFPLENELQEDVPYMAHFRGGGVSLRRSEFCMISDLLLSAL